MTYENYMKLKFRFPLIESWHPGTLVRLRIVWGCFPTTMVALSGFDRGGVMHGAQAMACLALCRRSLPGPALHSADGGSGSCSGSSQGCNAPASLRGSRTPASHPSTEGMAPGQGLSSVLLTKDIFSEGLNCAPRIHMSKL